MNKWQRKTTAEQLAVYLLEELKQWRWQGQMPGVMRLSAELGVSRDSVEAALRELERQGILQSKGPGRGRTINLENATSVEGGLRISILLGASSARHQTLVLKLVTALEDAGHSASFASKTLKEMGNNVERIARFVNQSTADAWVIYCGSRDVLEWFAMDTRPSFALAGRANSVQIPSIAPDKITPLRATIRKLVGLGHRRIVMLCRPIRRIPDPGLFERAFLGEMETLGIPTGPYNLPDWEDTTEDFHGILDSLFSLTPPTVLFIDEAPLVTATLQFCARKRLQLPNDFSLICTNFDPSFEWCLPSIAHIYRQIHPITIRIVQWANNVSEGKEDLKKGFSQAEFVEGGSIGPAPTGK
jgi:DNA-binding LacI/PurR family transcriptional regulator